MFGTEKTPCYCLINTVYCSRSQHLYLDFPDNEAGKKLRVEIKPISPNGKSTPSDNVDDIRTSVGMLRLSPTAGVSYRIIYTISQVRLPDKG